MGGLDKRSREEMWEADAAKVQLPAEERFPGYCVYYLDEAARQNANFEGRRFTWQKVLELATAAVGPAGDSAWSVANDRSKDVVVLAGRETGAEVLFLVERTHKTVQQIKEQSLKLHKHAQSVRKTVSKQGPDQRGHERGSVDPTYDTDFACLLDGGLRKRVGGSCVRGGEEQPALAPYVIWKEFDGDSAREDEHYDDWVGVFETVQQSELALKKLALGVVNPLHDLKEKRYLLELYPGSFCSRVTVGTDVTLIQHEDDADHGPTFATVCDGHTGVAAGYVLAQLKLGVQLFDGDCFYYQGAKIMHSAGTPLDMPAKGNGPVRAYVVAPTAAVLVKEAALLPIQDIKTWKMTRAGQKQGRRVRRKRQKLKASEDSE